MRDNAERLWRLRKNHTWIDVRVRERAGSGVELQFFYDGALVVTRSWATRSAAIAEAEDQRREFQRAGWNPHW